MKKILILITQKNGKKSHRLINPESKKLYSYNRKTKSYSKKSKIQLEKIRFISKSKKKEKVVSKRVKKQVEKQKEKIISKKVKPTKKVEPEIKTEYDLRTGYVVNTYQFDCKVSDRRIKHDFSIVDLLDSHLLESHESAYPDHEVMRVNYLSERFIEYKKGSPVNNDFRTEKQKDFLRHLGMKEEVIGIIKSKQEASIWISKMNEKKKQKEQM